jgi:hypothetical protein
MPAKQMASRPGFDVVILARTAHKLDKGPAAKYGVRAPIPRVWNTKLPRQEKKSGGPEVEGEVSNVERVHGASFLSPLEVNERQSG